MDIGAKIKELRKKRGITQERLAEYLNISPQAVSKWESGLGYPDITLLPTIASYFEVSIDSLFEINIDTITGREQEYRRKYKEMCAKGDINGRRELMRTALKEYPRNYEFMDNLARSIFHSISDNKDFDEIISLDGRIIKDCNDTTIVCSAIYNIVRAYSYMGEYKKAKQYANMLPTYKHSREEALIWALEDGVERDIQAQNNGFEYMLSAFDTLLERSGMGAGALSHRSAPLTDEQEIMIYNTIEQLYNMIFSDGNYLAVNGKLAQIHRFKARFYARHLEKEKAMAELLMAEKCADDFENQKNKDIKYTSVFFDRLTFETDDYVRHWDSSEHGRILRKINQWDCFDFIRNEPEFAALKERMESKVKDLSV
ncbi:MAG: helix-turn-helix domain-containing protein [Firmicutes bacterium]|nr:helix-turn-helix domain-containing protein [Bacillota bacterium]